MSHPFGTQILPTVAISDAVLAGCTLFAAWNVYSGQGRGSVDYDRSQVAVGLLLVGIAAAVGTLRFATALRPLITLHQLLTRYGATLALPLIACGAYHVGANYTWAKLGLAVLVLLLFCLPAGHRVFPILEPVLSGPAVLSLLVSGVMASREHRLPEEVAFSRVAAASLYIVSGLVGADLRSLAGVYTVNIFHYMLAAANLLFIKGFAKL